jgi:hypothetical protein
MAMKNTPIKNSQLKPTPTIADAFPKSVVLSPIHLKKEETQKQIDHYLAEIRDLAISTGLSKTEADRLIGHCHRAIDEIACKKAKVQDGIEPSRNHYRQRRHRVNSLVGKQRRAQKSQINPLQTPKNRQGRSAQRGKDLKALGILSSIGKNLSRSNDMLDKNSSFNLLEKILVFKEAYRLCAGLLAVLLNVYPSNRPVNTFTPFIPNPAQEEWINRRPSRIREENRDGDDQDDEGPDPLDGSGESGLDDSKNWLDVGRIPSRIPPGQESVEGDAFGSDCSPPTD